MSNFRQRNRMNVDYSEQKEAYFSTGENITWNPNGPDNLYPIYSDNPYWTFYENYQSDTRNRYFGNFALAYEITDWLNAIGRFSFDTYSALQEERINVGSADVASYSRFNNNVAEYNYDFMLNFDKYLTDNLSLEGTVGINFRRNKNNSIFAESNGGLSLDDYMLYQTVSTF